MNRELISYQLSIPYYVCSKPDDTMAWHYIAYKYMEFSSIEDARQLRDRIKAVIGEEDLSPALENDRIDLLQSLTKGGSWFVHVPIMYKVVRTEIK